MSLSQERFTESYGGYALESGVSMRVLESYSTAFGSPERMLSNAAPESNGTGSWTLGVQFAVNTNGRITHVRYWNPTAGANHNVFVWTTSDHVQRASAVDIAASVGWREVPLVTPLPVTAGTNYTTGFSTGAAAAYSYSLSAVPPSLAPDLSGYQGASGTGQDVFPVDLTTGGAYYAVDVVYQAAVTVSDWEYDFGVLGAPTGWTKAGGTGNLVVTSGALSSDLAFFSMSARDDTPVTTNKFTIKAEMVYVSDDGGSEGFWFMGAADYSTYRQLALLADGTVQEDYQNGGSTVGSGAWWTPLGGVPAYGVPFVVEIHYNAGDYTLAVGGTVIRTGTMGVGTETGFYGGVSLNAKSGVRKWTYADE